MEIVKFRLFAPKHDLLPAPLSVRSGRELGMNGLVAVQRIRNSYPSEVAPWNALGASIGVQQIVLC